GRTVPQWETSRCHYLLPGAVKAQQPLPPAPCRWAATSPCDSCARSGSCPWPSSSRSPDRTVPRWSESRWYLLLLLPAPCRWAAASPCDLGAGFRSCPWASRSRAPGRTVPRWPDSRWYLLLLPPAPCRWTTASPCDESARC